MLSFIYTSILSKNFYKGGKMKKKYREVTNISHLVH